MYICIYIYVYVCIFKIGMFMCIRVHSLEFCEGFVTLAIAGTRRISLSFRLFMKGRIPLELPGEAGKKGEAARVEPWQNETQWNSASGTQAD